MAHIVLVMLESAVISKVWSYKDLWPNRIAVCNLVQMCSVVQLVL